MGGGDDFWEGLDPDSSPMAKVAMVPSERDLIPVPGQGAKDRKFDRLAAEEAVFEDRAKLYDTLTESRGTGFAITQLGERLGGQAKDVPDLERLIRQQFSSHALKNDAEAQKLAEAAYKAFGKRQAIGSEYAEIMSAAIAQEYRDIVAKSRRAEVASRAKEMENDLTFVAQQEWQEKIEALSQLSGLDYTFVEAFVLEHDKLTAQKHPGKIDPRGVPMFQLQVPLEGVATAVNILTAGTAGSLASFVTGIGRDGDKLSTLARLLEGVLGIMAIAAPGGSNVILEAIQIGKIAGASLKLILKTARSLAQFAFAGGIKVSRFLRMLGKLRKLDPDKVAAFFKRVESAQAAGKALQVTGDDASLMRWFDKTFQLGEEATDTAKVGKTKALQLAEPTAQAFKFLNRKQPLVLGRLLDRVWTTPIQKMAKTAMQEAEDIAASIRSRVAAHWQAALPSGKKDALEVCEDVFKKLSKKAAASKKFDANGYVRKALFSEWRKRAMSTIGKDADLVRDLKNEAGIIVGQNKKTGTWAIHVRTKKVGDKFRTQIDFDHAAIGHAKAVEEALRLKDARKLVSTIDAGNLQFMTQRENRNFIEALRAAMEEMGQVQ